MDWIELLNAITMFGWDRGWINIYGDKNYGLYHKGDRYAVSVDGVRRMIPTDMGEKIRANGELWFNNHKTEIKNY